VIFLTVFVSPAYLFPTNSLKAQGIDRFARNYVLHEHNSESIVNVLGRLVVRDGLDYHTVFGTEKLAH
jgi:hypothetical protein